MKMEILMFMELNFPKKFPQDDFVNGNFPSSTRKILSYG